MYAVLLSPFPFQLLEKGTKLVLEQIVTTTATVADVAEELFVKYYDRFMPSFKYIVANATGKEYRLLRGKTIECISLTGLAVGTEKVCVCVCACVCACACACACACECVCVCVCVCACVCTCVM